MLLARLENIGLASVLKVSLAHHVIGLAEMHLVARLEVGSAVETLFLAIGEADRGVRKILLHSLTLLW